MTVDELYDQSIKQFSSEERLQLAKRILNDIPSKALINFNTEWSDEDFKDISQYSSKIAESQY